MLDGKTAIVVGGGQTPGETIGNGRATAIQFAREGARVLVGDRNLASAEETVDMITAEGGVAIASEVDVSDEGSVAELIAQCHETWERIDILHNNVGVSIAGGDATVDEITTEAFEHLVNINLRGMILTRFFWQGSHLRAVSKNIAKN